ncbi:MAG: 4-demethylwyosine synthase TYW1 [Sulfolobales archaeon]|nr:4-demethylwyosine synthase TYW1 [Sulfolobales archaeon]
MFTTLKKQGYHLIGSHAAVKKCLWVHNALAYGKFCYKCRFYGIESHRCIQFSPAVSWCWNFCLHCWRARPSDYGMEGQELLKLPYVEDPEVLADMAILEHRRTVSGYARRAPKEMYREALDPKHVAISLTGEATLYPRLGELIEVFHRRGLTTFLVTRGIRPDILANLEEEPTQLYVSIETWNEDMYREFNKPAGANLWKLTLKTLELLQSLRTRTVVRITLVKDFNMGSRDVSGFAKLIERSGPTFIETKAYMHVGASISRLTRSSMPTYEEVLEFAKKLADATGYRLVSSSKPSRVALLTKLEKPLVRYGKGCPKSWEEVEIEGEKYVEEYR